MEEHLHFEAKQVEHHPVWENAEISLLKTSHYFAKSIAPLNQPEEDSIVFGKEGLGKN